MDPTTTVSRVAATPTISACGGCGGGSYTENPQQQPAGFFSYANGPLKCRYPTVPKVDPTAPPITYKECLRNHAATISGQALDGCCEFMPCPTATEFVPTSLKCAACGCHRNFHRRDPDDPLPIHHHQPALPPPPLPQQSQPPSDSSPPGTKFGAFHSSSASQMLLALSQIPSGAGSGPGYGTCSPGKKRFRTRFTQEQERMLEFSEKLGWKMQRSNERAVAEFCDEIGVGRGVLKVWMHNNKLNFAKKETSSSNNNNNKTINYLNSIKCENSNNSSGNGSEDDDHGFYHDHRDQGNYLNSVRVVPSNRSSSSSDYGAVSH